MGWNMEQNFLLLEGKGATPLPEMAAFSKIKHCNLQIGL
jgi:hypothetical protein